MEPEQKEPSVERVPVYTPEQIQAQTERFESEIWKPKSQEQKP
jgi:hypothetical protein